MTYQTDCTLPEELLEQLAAEGFDALPELVRILINEAMRLEREHHLGAGHYERTEERCGYANGYKPKTVKTRVGQIQFAVPQVRHGDFYPDALEKGLRSERALTLALAEMYVQGDFRTFFLNVKRGGKGVLFHGSIVLMRSKPIGITFQAG